MQSWTDLSKSDCKNHQTLSPTSSLTRFSQVAFDSTGQSLVVVDISGQAYLVDLIRPIFAYKKLGHVGQCTFINFSPLNDEDLLIGLTADNKIKVAQLTDVASFCFLYGHSLPARKASFYQHFCLTVSINEAIIWCLETYSKAHHLRLLAEDLCIKTALFSPSGLISILYKNNVIQCWKFRNFEDNIKLNLNEFDLQNVKDLAFSGDGKLMILGGSRNMLVFDSKKWKVIKKLNYTISSSVNKLMVVEKPFNFVVLLLHSDCTLEMFDISSSKSIKYCQCKSLKIIKRMEVSQDAKLLAHVRSDGELVISNLNIILAEKTGAKNKEVPKVCAHRAEDHLQYIQMAIKKELKLERLLLILREFGEYPKRHRALIWSTVIGLPENKDAYLVLVKSVTECLDEEPIESYDLKDKSKATLLGTMVRCLVKWCPLLEHCEFLPKLVFPFAMVLQKNPLWAFETSVTIILNFCQKWFEYHPLPPLNILGIVENILLEADPELLDFFSERNITSSDYAWPLLSSSFSEVLSASEWLILWDHLLSYGRPSLLLCCAVACNLCSREVILTSMKTPEDVARFYSSQSQIQAGKLLKVAENLDKLMPRRIHPSQYIRDKVESLPASDLYPPLPQLEYPKVLVEDFQLKDTKKQSDYQKERMAEEITENKRLKKESANFRKLIEKKRMEELRKCYETVEPEVRGSVSVNWDSYEVQKVQKPSSSKKKFVNEKIMPKRKNDFREMMEQQVQQLEEETRNLYFKKHLNGN